MKTEKVVITGLVQYVVDAITIANSQKNYIRYNYIPTNHPQTLVMKKPEYTLTGQVFDPDGESSRRGKHPDHTLQRWLLFTLQPDQDK